MSWRKIAGVLAGGGTVALVSYFGLEGSRSAGDQQALRVSRGRTEARG